MVKSSVDIKGTDEISQGSKSSETHRSIVCVRNGASVSSCSGRISSQGQHGFLSQCTETAHSIDTDFPEKIRTGLFLLRRLKREAHSFIILSTFYDEKQIYQRFSVGILILCNYIKMAIEILKPL